MWSVFGETDLFLITTNPVVRKDGAVVMGRGIALQAKTRFPKLPFDFGSRLKKLEELKRVRKMGTIGVYEHQPVGFFMVKDHFAQEAKLSIIQSSVRDLLVFLYDGPEDYRVDLNFPGIGNGRLSREEVLPIIEQLPDNVHVWEYGDA